MKPILIHASLKYVEVDQFGSRVRARENCSLILYRDARGERCNRQVVGAPTNNKKLCSLDKRTLINDFIVLRTDVSEESGPSRLFHRTARAEGFYKREMNSTLRLYEPTG